NPVLLAKQLASVEQISGGRLTVGLGLGGWPEDYVASQAPQTGRAALWETTLATMRQAWTGTLRGQSGPMSALPEGRPALLFGGTVPPAHKRASTEGEGWVAPSLGLSLLQDGAAAVRRAWSDAGRPGQPRIVVERYFCLGAGADAIADAYIRHYYGDDFFPAVRADTLTTPDRLRSELEALKTAGATDVILLPASGDRAQIGLLSATLRQSGFLPAPDRE
ncbi:MAG TPA: LLM class flavin-dependent oxidoreductase, partial [Thermomicrobiales bacterium]|nr:LLM class flavin-dependent oxidoreductase [Thermomicrobiales bacterium]